MSLEGLSNKSSSYSKIEPNQKSANIEKIVEQKLEKIDSVSKPNSAKDPWSDGCWGGLKGSAEKLGKAKASIEFSDQPIKMEKLEKLIEKFNPKAIVDDIRQAKGTERDSALLNFDEKISNLSSKQLRSIRDYIGDAMADPKNKDDQLLGSMLKVVNNKLDSESNVIHHKEKEINPWLDQPQSVPVDPKNPFNNKKFEQNHPLTTFPEKHFIDSSDSFSNKSESMISQGIKEESLSKLKANIEEIQKNIK